MFLHVTSSHLHLGQVTMVPWWAVPWQSSSRRCPSCRLPWVLWGLSGGSDGGVPPGSTAHLGIEELKHVESMQGKAGTTAFEW